jgi:hypothetical protein
MRVCVLLCLVALIGCVFGTTPHGDNDVPASWSGCVFMEHSGEDAPAEDPAVTLQWPGVTTLVPVASLTVKTMLNVVDTIKSCGEQIVVLEQGAVVADKLSLSKWLSFCLKTSANLHRVFGGCALSSHYFLSENVTVDPALTHAHAVNGFLTSNLMVPKSLLLAAVALAKEHDLNPDMRWNDACSIAVRIKDAHVLYPTLPTHVDLITTTRRLSAGCSVTSHAVAFDKPLKLHIWRSTDSQDKDSRVVAAMDPPFIPHMLTVVLPSNSKRVQTLFGTIRHYCTLPFVHEIIVVWNDVAVEPPFSVATGTALAKAVGLNVALQGSLLSGHLATVRIVQQSTASVNNRFQPSSVLGMLTAAVLSVNDDVRIDLSDVSRAFSAWRLAPDRVIGFDFSARGMIDAAGGDEQLYVPADHHCNHLRSNGTLALASAALYHRDWARIYFSPAAIKKSLREQYLQAWNTVEETQAGEDLLFGLLVVAESGLGPVVIENAKLGKPVAIGEASSADVAARNALAKKFVAVFGPGCVRRHSVTVESEYREAVCLLDPAPQLALHRVCSVTGGASLLSPGTGSVWFTVCIVAGLVCVAFYSCVHRVKGVSRVWVRYLALVSKIRGKQRVV